MVKLEAIPDTPKPLEKHNFFDILDEMDVMNQKKSYIQNSLPLYIPSKMVDVRAGCTFVC